MGKGTTEDKVTLELAHGFFDNGKAGGEEEEAMEIGETDYRVKIAVNETNCNNFNKMFSKKELLTYNTTPSFYKDLLPRLRNNLVSKQNHLI